MKEMQRSGRNNKFREDVDVSDDEILGNSLILYCIKIIIVKIPAPTAHREPWPANRLLASRLIVSGQM